MLSITTTSSSSSSSSNALGGNTVMRLTAEQSQLRCTELNIALLLLDSCLDGNAAVRREALVAISKVVVKCCECFEHCVW